MSPQARGRAASGPPAPEAGDLLFLAAARRRLAGATALLVVGCGADPRRRRNGLAPLHVAAIFDNAEAASALLAHGADAGAVDAELRRNALHFAAQSGSAAALAALLAATRGRARALLRAPSRLGDARAVAADDARAAVDAAAAAPLWRRVGAPVARALSPRLTASLPARGRGAAPPFRAGDGAAARVLVGALALRHALGDVADALTTSEPACELPFDAACVEAVARLRGAVDGVAAAGAVDAARVAAVEAALGALARFWPAARADAPERPPPRAAAWPAGARAPHVFAYARRGDAAAYAGVLGPPAELATRAGLPPLDQLAWWRFLLRHRGAVLLPFVDAERNAVTFINDARGPARSGPPPAGAAAANVEFAEVGGVVAVRALEDIAPGAALLIDYGDAYWHFAPKLADLRARLLDFVDVLAAARAWPRAARRALARPPLAPALVDALRGEFGDPARARTRRADAAAPRLLDPAVPKGGARAWRPAEPPRA